MTVPMSMNGSSTTISILAMSFRETGFFMRSPITKEGNTS